MKIDIYRGDKFDLFHQTKGSKFTQGTVWALCLIICAFLLLSMVALFQVDRTLNEGLFVLTYLFWFFFLLYTLSDLRKHLLLCFFLLCFFIFLFGRNFLSYVETGEFQIFTKFHELQLTQQEYFLFITAMFGSLASIFLAYYFLRRARPEQGSPLREFGNRERESNVLRLRKFARIGFYVTMPFEFLVKLDSMLLRLSSYVDSYLVGSRLPSIFAMISAFFFGFSMVLLATRPSRKEAIRVLVIFFFIDGVLEFLGGTRLSIASIILFIIWFLAKYDEEETGKKFLRRTTILAIFILGILMVLLFALRELLRESKAASYSPWNLIRYFFDSTGGSDGILANLIRYRDSFPEEGVVYFFNDINRMFFDNSITRKIVSLLTGVPAVATPVGQGVDYLTQYHSFAAWLTAIVDYNRYLMGHGMGSSYIAETYFAFGIVGILVIGLLLGVVIFCQSRMRLFGGHVYRNAFLMMMCYNLFGLPRSSFFSLVNNLQYFFIVIVAIALLNRVCRKKNENELNRKIYRDRKHESRY